MNKLILSLFLLSFLAACEVSGPSVKVEPPKVRVDEKYVKHEHHDHDGDQGNHYGKKKKKENRK